MHAPQLRQISLTIRKGVATSLFLPLPTKPMAPLPICSAHIRTHNPHKIQSLFSILNLFVDICLLRKGPQDVPMSSVLLGLAWLANLLAGVLLVGKADLSSGRILAESLADTLIMLGFVWIMLSFRKLSSRFVQAGTAAMGSSALINLCALPLVAAANMQGSEQVAGVPGLILLGLVVWSVVIFGHILRHSLDVRMGQGVMLALAYTLFSLAFMSSLFGSA